MLAQEQQDLVKHGPLLLYQTIFVHITITVIFEEILMSKNLLFGLYDFWGDVLEEYDFLLTPLMIVVFRICI